MKGCKCHFTKWQIHPSYPRGPKIPIIIMSSLHLDQNIIFADCVTGRYVNSFYLQQKNTTHLAEPFHNWSIVFIIVSNPIMGYWVCFPSLIRCSRHAKGIYPQINQTGQRLGFRCAIKIFMHSKVLYKVYVKQLALIQMFQFGLVSLLTKSKVDITEFNLCFQSQ